MAGYKRQTWVTAALEDRDVSKALVLAQSLRRSFTNRSIAVIASPKLSFQLRDLLSQEFDSVHLLEEDRNICCLKTTDFAKLFALTLGVFEKAVFISNDSLVIKNSDKIFDSFDALTFTENMDTSIFAFRPSMNTFKNLMDGLSALNGNKGSLEKYLCIWQQNQQECIQKLDRCYNKVISLTNQLVGNENEIAILNFAEDPLTNVPSLSEDELKSMGILNSIAIKYWKEIFQNDVLPKVEAVENATTVTESPSLTNRRYDREPIAIIGMSCRYPGSNNLDEFWDLLVNGLDAVKPPPDFRWTKDQATRNGAEYRKTTAGFLKVPVDEFDAKFFSLSPKEVAYMDPQIRLLHELVWESLEDASINALELRGSNTGVFIGSWTNDFKDILIHAGNKEFYRLYMGNSIGSAAARISHLLSLTGSSLATESGCSSGMKFNFLEQNAQLSKIEDLNIPQNLSVY